MVTEALIRVEIERDAEVMSFYNQAVKFKEYAEARVIRKVEDLEPANNDLIIIRQLKKAMKAKRKEYVKPFQDHIEEINDAFTAFMGPVETADKVTGDKILAFAREQDRLRAEAEKLERDALDVAKRQEALTGEHTVNLNPIPMPELVVKTTRTELGAIITFKVRKWEVIDFVLVPNDLKLIDAGKVTKLVKAGIGSIAGIRIYEEDSLRTTTK